MSAQIYYFSGTGNSLFVAKELQKRLIDAELIPIVRLLDQKLIQTRSGTVGIVFPVHSLTIPIAVKKFLQKAVFDPSAYIFAAATRLGTVFRGFEKIDRLLAKKKKRLDCAFILNMCNNEARHGVYRVPDEEEIQTLEKEVLRKLDAVQRFILNRLPFREKDETFTVSFTSRYPVVNNFMEKTVTGGIALAEHIGGVNYFYADEKCAGCGLCEKVCLSKKIVMKNNKPVWQRKTLCYMCFACLNFCPRQAVQIRDIPGVKSLSRENGRYPHPYASALDIMAQKEE